MKLIEKKIGNKTIYKLVPDNYVEAPEDIPQKDLTTGGASLITINMTKDQYKEIFNHD